MHRAATFRDRQHVERPVGKYVTSLLFVFFLNLILLDATVERLGLDPLVAQALVTAVVTLASYLLQTHWVFRSHGGKVIVLAATPEDDRGIDDESAGEVEAIPMREDAPRRRCAA